MATYLIHAQWTEQGIRNVKESPKRLDLGRKKLKEMGGEMKAFYMTINSRRRTSSARRLPKEKS